MNLSEHEKKEWKEKNRLLQEAYNNYRWATNQREKDKALTKIQMIIEQNPFLTYCANNGALLSGITRYGLDYKTERCISDINKIANNL